MLAPEIGRRVILPLFDDRPPARARAREPALQLVGIAAADRLVQPRQILVEPLQGREHGIPVGEEDIAPHPRIARRAARESAATSGPIFAQVARATGRERVGKYGWRSVDGVS